MRRPRQRKPLQHPKKPTSRLPIKHPKAEQRQSMLEAEFSDQEDVEVTFETYNVSEIDFHAIQQFLLGCFGPHSHGIPVSRMASLLVDTLAEDVGTCLKQAEEGEQGDAYAFVSLLPLGPLGRTLGREQFNDVVASVEQFLLNKHVVSADGKKKRGDEPFEGIALLINERMMNLPGDVGAPLLLQVLADWQKAEAEDPQWAKIYQVLLLIPMYSEVKAEVSDDDDEGDGGKGEDDSSSTKNSNASAQFYHPEEENGLKAIKGQPRLDVTFTVASTHSTSDSRRVFGDLGSKPFRRAVLLSRQQFEDFCHGLAY